jgi:hypothetical protein
MKNNAKISILSGPTLTRDQMLSNYREWLIEEVNAGRMTPIERKANSRDWTQFSDQRLLTMYTIFFD